MMKTLNTLITVPQPSSRRQGPPWEPYTTASGHARVMKHSMLVFGNSINTRAPPQHGRTSPLPSSPFLRCHHHMNLEVSPSHGSSRHHLHPKMRVDIQGVTFYTRREPGGPGWRWRGLAPRVASFCHATFLAVYPPPPPIILPSTPSIPHMSPTSLPSHLPSPPYFPPSSSPLLCLVHPAVRSSASPFHRLLTDLSPFFFFPLPFIVTMLIK